jgi:hypothetical protein
MTTLWGLFLIGLVTGLLLGSVWSGALSPKLSGRGRSPSRLKRLANPRTFWQQVEFKLVIDLAGLRPIRRSVLCMERQEISFRCRRFRLGWGQ